MTRNLTVYCDAEIFAFVIVWDNSMNLEQCKSTVQMCLRQFGGFNKHIDNGQLLVMHQGYRIQPDDSYIFNNRVIVIEYEKTKRPVESISKYWWLFENTSWKSLQMKMSCGLLLLNQDLNEIRTESVFILGRELEAKYPDYFKFSGIKPRELTEDNLRTLIENICRNQ
jgi:hypothetical protein